MKFGVCRSLDAMVRPQHLRLAVEFAHLEGFFPRMLRGEAAVVGGVPVLRGDDQVIVSAVHQRIGDRHDLLAIGDRQIAARAEAVLDIDQQQGAGHGLCPFDWLGRPQDGKGEGRDQGGAAG